MIALAQAGRQGDALDTFTRARDMLISQLGVEPGNELRQAQSEVLSGTQCGTSTIRHLLADPDFSAVPGSTGPSAVAVTPRQLPPSVAGFTGRDVQLRQLDNLVAESRDRLPGTLSIALITGEPGAGKTSLATHWAHRAAGHFPDGQLYGDLTTSAPNAVLEQFLRALGLMPQGMPDTLEEKAALYRSLLADKRVLVLLENVRDAAQVRPMLPGNAECLVLVTSRHELPELVSAYGAFRLPLGMLNDGEASQLVRLLVTGGYVDADPFVTEAAIRQCAGRPLALRQTADRILTEALNMTLWGQQVSA
jgi:hypothetical protein